MEPIGWIGEKDFHSWRYYFPDSAVSRFLHEGPPLHLCSYAAVCVAARGGGLGDGTEGCCGDGAGDDLEQQHGRCNRRRCECGRPAECAGKSGSRRLDGREEGKLHAVSGAYAEAVFYACDWSERRSHGGSGCAAG